MANPLPSNDLKERLAAVLPKDQSFNVYHLSTPPTKCDPLCSSPPGQRPDRTYCEKHFLAVAIDQAPEGDQKKQIFVLGVEIFIFTTARATTIFVAKADSTGYLHLLKLPAGTRSPIREVCAAFVKFLVDNRQRKDVQLVVSLFARAQGQYLFPGSVKNQGKHVLDDRGLVKWWCRVFDPLLEPTIRGYLVVPGMEIQETKAFMPRGSNASGQWTADHPLERISHYTKEFDWVPPRCLIPRYPDDPKSRFRDELDEEATGSAHFRATGGWKSIRTLETFWETMAFRQECSSGRLTGFIWVVFNDEPDQKDLALPTPEASFSVANPPSTPQKQRTISNNTPSTTPRKLFPTAKDSKPIDLVPKKRSKKPKKKKLTGPIIARKPRPKTARNNHLLKQPAHTAYYTWDPAGRGEKIVSEKDYNRIVELLLHLDFATTGKAVGSTQRWVNETSIWEQWGYTVVGQRETPVVAETESNGPQINNLSGLVKRKRADSGTKTVEPNLLSAGLVRKKPKA